MLRCMLNNLLIKNGISQTKVTNETGIRPQTVTDFCTNKYVYVLIDKMDILCRYLGCPPGVLFTNKNNFVTSLEQPRFGGEVEINNNSVRYIKMDYTGYKLYCRLEILLNERNMSKKDLALLTKVRPTTISHIANQKAERIRKQDITAICDVLNCDFSELYCYI